MGRRFMSMKEFEPQGVVCPCPGAIYMYSLIFFNVQGGACQFLIDNDKVDHYI